jgi:UDP-N-acetylmuramate--alanine ligase
MYNLNHKLHFVGIGGVGMAGIAEVLITLGYQVSGSDMKHSALTEHLSSLGAEISIGHRADSLSDDVKVVVISSAVHEDNVEYREAVKRSIPVIPRAEMLSELMRMKYGIAIAGSHGKTSTTSMTSKVLKDLGLDPTIIIGGRILSHQTGASLGSGQYLVAEADESDGSFCMLRPAISVVTNIDAEHMSYYKSFGALEEAFLRFMNSVPFYGLTVYCGDDPVLQRLSERLTRRSVSYGISSFNDISAQHIEFNGWMSSFDLVLHGTSAGRVELPLPGIHMISNSLAAIAVSLELGAYPYEAINSLKSFPGISRRSEKVSEVHIPDSGSVLVLDDYAHHPSEIKATLRAMKSSILPDHDPDGRLIVVFQPHRYSRTKELFTDFISSFTDADILLVTEIYSAGELPIEGVSGKILAESITNTVVRYIPSFDEVTEVLLSLVKTGDVVLTAGAGSISKYPKELAERLSRHFDPAMSKYGNDHARVN